MTGRLGLAVLLVLLSASMASCSHRTAFDAAGWRKRLPANDQTHEEMADDLIARRVLEGKTQQQIVDLLGSPPPTDYFREWSMVYWLGNERGWMSIDSEWLVIRLENGRATKVKLVTD